MLHRNLHANVYLRIVIYIYTFVEYVGEFEIQRNHSSTQGLEYQLTSIMHLSFTAFSLHDAKVTMEPLLPIAFRRHSFEPTMLDYGHLNILYCGGEKI